MDDIDNSLGKALHYVTEFIQSLPPRKKKNIDGIEIVFLDNINGHMKHNRSYTLSEVIEALQSGGTPIGIILMKWDAPEEMEFKELPGISSEAQAVLIHAFAEAQDEVNETYTS